MTWFKLVSVSQHPMCVLVLAVFAATLGPMGQAAAQSGVQSHDGPTYSNEVARIVQANCQSCHQPGQIGPMSLTNYRQVRRHAPRIRALVAAREMPPYHYDTDVGIQELQNDWRMSDDDIQTFVAWIDAGTPEGDPADLPAPIEFPPAGEWRMAADFGQPDHVIKSRAWDVPANGQDLWWDPEVPSGITEERCIKAVETKPSVAAHGATHHANSQFQVQNEDGEWVTYGRLSEYAYGKLGEVVPIDGCRVAPADSRVRWNIHYFPNGTQVDDDQVSIGIWYHDEDFNAEEAYPQDLSLYRLQGGDYDIPPHGTLTTQGMHSFDHPVRIDSWQPHMHLRGAAMSIEIFYPETGRREMVSQVSNWNAGWNHSHIYEEGAQPLIPAGAVIILNGWHDNTANNPRNPDPDQWVATGQRTTDEMSHAWIAVTHLDQEGYEKLLAARKSKPVTQEWDR